ncbi:hypothetical protein H5410_011084 [Solanum commersonii]|uniref:Uncharacterized protein n=1 Tax=Solanum commersonii TaxID=4109 RepID=A0A9J6ANZ3_SOLCO|nr:hypothetical protein H5410_011084 [Solanum commersonii]
MSSSASQVASSTNWFLQRTLTDATPFHNILVYNNNRASFRDCLNQCRMVDLGLNGSKYMWSNKRYKNRRNLILERLDRCLAINFWILKYP